MDKSMEVRFRVYSYIHTLNPKPYIHRQDAFRPCSKPWYAFARTLCAWVFGHVAVILSIAVYTTKAQILGQP